MQPERWRLFIGLLLPAAHYQRLAEVQQELVGQQLAVRWIRPANFHITLHFLGDVAAELVPGLQQHLATTLALLPGPILALDTLGAFPDLRQPNVLWAGISGSLDLIIALHEAATAAGETIGVAPEERPFHPHITLGYVRKEVRPAERAAIATQLKAQPIPESSAEPYTQLALMRSTLQREGAIYTPLHVWEIGNGK